MTDPHAVWVSEKCTVSGVLIFMELCIHFRPYTIHPLTVWKSEKCPVLGVLFFLLLCMITSTFSPLYDTSTHRVDERESLHNRHARRVFTYLFMSAIQPQEIKCIVKIIL